MQTPQSYPSLCQKVEAERSQVTPSTVDLERLDRARRCLEHTRKVTNTPWLADLCAVNLVRLSARQALAAEHQQGLDQRRFDRTNLFRRAR